MSAAGVSQAPQPYENAAPGAPAPTSEPAAVALAAASVPHAPKAGHQAAATGLRVGEVLEGVGELSAAGRTLGVARYALKRVEETPPVAPPEHAHRPSDMGKPNYAGVVLPDGPEPLARFLGERLALRLVDGRVLPCTLARVLGRASYLLQGLGEPA